MNQVKIIDRRRGKNRTPEEAEEMPGAPHQGVLTRMDIAKDRPSMAQRIRWIKDHLEQTMPDYITVIGDDPEETFGRIIIPSDAQGRPTSGTIVIVGEDCPAWYKPGQRIIYTEFCGVTLPLKNWNCRAMRWSEAPWRIKAGKAVRVGPGARS